MNEAPPPPPPRPATPPPPPRVVVEEDVPAEAAAPPPVETETPNAVPPGLARMQSKAVLKAPVEPARVPSKSVFKGGNVVPAAAPVVPPPS